MSFFRASKKSPSVTLKIAPDDPLRPFRLHLSWFLGSLLVIVAILIYARLVTAPGFSDLRVERNDALTENRDLKDQIRELNGKLAIAERRVQVADAAERELQKTLAEHLRREARLKADLSFYERMLGGEQKNTGLTAFSLSLRKTAAAGVYRYTLTLAQNLRDADVVSGLASMSLDGAQQGTLKTLNWAALTRGSGGVPLPFSFKYFARLEGQLLVPDDFQAATFSIRMDPENGAAITQQIPWNQTLTSEE